MAPPLAAVVAGLVMATATVARPAAALSWCSEYPENGATLTATLGEEICATFCVDPDNSTTSVNIFPVGTHPTLFQLRGSFLSQSVDVHNLCEGLRCSSAPPALQP